MGHFYLAVICISKCSLVMPLVDLSALYFVELDAD